MLLEEKTGKVETEVIESGRDLQKELSEYEQEALNDIRDRNNLGKETVILLHNPHVLERTCGDELVDVIRARPELVKL